MPDSVMIPQLTKAFLKKVYSEEGLSTWAIEAKYGFSRSRVHNTLKRYGLPRRNLAQSHIRYPRKDFSGDLCEKAYLIGFAIGDLRVRNHGGEQSETISIACGSTKPAQIALIHDIFSSYGRVWIGKPDIRGAVNTEAFVNESFSFLLPGARSYKWCKKSRKHFFAFLAGFTDAEGSFFISNNKAHVSWGNYDRKILAFIHNMLLKFGVAVSKTIVCHSRAGLIGSSGYVWNKDYYYVHCARKESIRNLISKLEPYLRHADKHLALRKIKTNLIARGVKL